MLCVAGYIITQEQAVHLNREWRDALARFGLSMFRMTDCAQGVGEFKTLSKPQRIEVEKRMIGIIKRRAERGFAFTVNEKQYAERIVSQAGRLGRCVLQMPSAIVQCCDRVGQRIRVAGEGLICF